MAALEATQGQFVSQISYRCQPILVAFVWESTQETIDLRLGCLQGGCKFTCLLFLLERSAAAILRFITSKVAIMHLSDKLSY